jgi:hypothetical protein
MTFLANFAARSLLRLALCLLVAFMAGTVTPWAYGKTFGRFIGWIKAAVSKETATEATPAATPAVEVK